MPASRSRTENWQSCLQRIIDRGGAIEISLERAGDQTCVHDLVWRVRAAALRDGQIIVDSPAAFGEPVDFRPGAKLIGAMTVGQNRWMFHTEVIARWAGSGSQPGTLALRAPDRVERCSRRSLYRISTADLRLPEATCWPLLDPTSVIAAETTDRLQLESLLNPTEDGGAMLSTCTTPLLLPEVAPPFPARVTNISGGGLGMIIDRRFAGPIGHRPHVWVRLDLSPEIPVPFGVTARVVHSRLDSSQNIQAGMAFEFDHNPRHRQFVFSIISRYMNAVLAAQSRGQTALAAG